MSNEDNNSDYEVTRCFEEEDEEEDGFTIEEHPLPSLEELGCSLSDSEYVEITDDNVAEPSKDYYDPYAEEKKILISSDLNGADVEQQCDNPPEEQETQTVVTDDVSGCVQSEESDLQKTEECTTTDEHPQVASVGEKKPRYSNFNCEVCEFVCWTKFALVQHLKTHSADTKPKTQHTVQTLSDTKIKIVNSSPKKYSCTKCSFTADVEKSFMEHMDDHENVLSCEQCSYETKSYNMSHFFAHFTKKHPQSCSKCAACQSNFPRGMEEEHNKMCRMKKVHVVAKRFQCKYCSFANSIKAKMQQHLKLHTLRKVPILKCDFCELKLTNIALQHHLRKVHNVDTDKEGVPKASTQQKMNGTNDNIETKPQPKENGEKKIVEKPKKPVLKIHREVNAAKKETAYKCPFCPLKLTPLALRKHCSTKHRRSEMARLDRLFKCDHCSYNTDKNISYNAHLNEHSDDAPIRKCPSCPRKFTAKSLALHKLKAHDQMKHQCNLCSYSTQNVQTYLYHVDIHKKGIAVYQCAFCPKKFMSVSLRTHYRETHAYYEAEDKAEAETAVVESNLQCQLCPYSIKTQSMRSHLEKHMKDSQDDDGELIKMDTYNCILCSYVAQRKKIMRLHFRLHEKGDDVYDCQYCSAKFTAQALHSHCYRVHGKKITIDKPKIRIDRPKVSKCEQCSFATTNPASMQAHVDAHLKGASVHPCPYCPKKLTYASLRKHCFKVHKKGPEGPNAGDNVMECPFCSKKYTYFAAIKTHCRNVHKQNYTLKTTEVVKPEPEEVTDDSNSEGLFKCKYCSYTNHSKHNLDSHMKQHEKNKPVFVCPYCPMRYTRTCLANHCVKVHERELKLPNQSLTKVEPESYDSDEKEDSELKLNCDSCSFSTSNKKNFEAHSGLHEKNVPIYECPYCSDVYTNLSLITHCKKVHGKTPQVKIEAKIKKEESEPQDELDDRVPTFKCKHCNFVTVRRKSWVVHMKQHLKNLPIYDCPFCPKRYTSRCLISHCKKVHGKRPLIPVKKELDGMDTDEDDSELYECTNCSYLTKSQTDYKAHIKTHGKNTETVRKCRYCQKKFTETDLLTHIEEFHLDEKSTTRQCAYCSFKTNCPWTLETHIKGHKLEKTVLCQCPYCDAVLSNTKMTNHCRDVHKTKPLYPLQIVKEKPMLTCTYCSYSTKLNSKLIAHMKEHDDNQKCSLCNLTFPSNALDKHYKMVHGSEDEEESPEEETKTAKHKCTKCPFTTKSYATLVRHMMNIHVNAKQNAEEHAQELQPGSSLEIKLSIANTYGGDSAMVPKFVIPSNAVYVCEFCDYTTSEKIDLFKHKEIHKSNSFEQQSVKEDLDSKC